jgi:hypothetical protein
MPKLNYSLVIDKHFPKYGRYRSLRTIFDMGASEWNNYDLEKKLEVLQNLLTVKPFEFWVTDYCKYYKTLKKPYVADAVTESIVYYYKKSVELELADLSQTIRTFLLTTNMNYSKDFNLYYRAKKLQDVFGEEFAPIQESFDREKIERMERLKKNHPDLYDRIYGKDEEVI